MNSVEVRSAYKCYGKHKDHRIVLNKLNMTVAPGSIYGLMGASGCGKTTLLSCILGIVDLDGGDITVLREKTKNGEIHKAGNKIGYMPQETALISELSIKETIYYFGNIFQMEKDKLRERYQMLRNLLELPHDDHRIEDCSGGQQRRVSFAAAMIHEPELLILDEPTVGLDPILREKIWDFMLHVTRTSKLAIIITTHYIEEAKSADRCGLMRNGILLAEDSPRAIIERHQCENLEEAFLRLCMKRGVNEDAEDSVIIEKPNEYELSNDYNLSISHNPNDIAKENNLPKRKYFNKRTMKALMYKNFIQLLRQPAAITFLSLVPIIQIFFFYMAIGGNPIGLKIGIVNDEIVNFQDCTNTSLITTFVHDYTCDMNLISCRFLNEITEDVGEKKYYDNYDSAYKDARKGNLIAILYFASNFTESLHESFDSEIQSDPITKKNRIISLYLDQTNQQLTHFLQRKFYDVYQRYSTKLMTDCNYPVKLESIPMELQKPIYGSFDADFKQTMAPPMIMVMLFYTAAGITIAIFTNERKNGVWNRTLLAGVDIVELIISHITVESLILMIQLIEVVILARFVFQADKEGNYMLVAALFGLLGLAGMSFGMTVSCFSDNLMQSNLLITGMAQPMMIISGMFWPLEGMPQIIRYFSYISPFTYPSISVRNIMTKGFGITHPTVYLGFLVVIAWTGVLLWAGLQSLRIKKYSRNT